MYKSDYVQTLDQHSQTNLNSSWMNDKGAWVTNVLIVVLIKFFFGIIPGISPELSWSMTTLTYNGSYVMFHAVTGVPFEFSQGAYDGITLWEQIDGGEQFTATRKYLTTVPIVLFLVSTHYTHYAPSVFFVNLVLTVINLIAKLPAMHQVRLFDINQKVASADEDLEY
ncbi:MAG: ORMDL family [Podila humilis]|nr:MAG: ORMDL family [Podila humilis]